METVNTDRDLRYEQYRQTVKGQSLLYVGLGLYSDANAESLPELWAFTTLRSYYKPQSLTQITRCPNRALWSIQQHLFSSRAVLTVYVLRNNVADCHVCSNSLSLADVYTN